MMIFIVCNVTFIYVYVFFHIIKVTEKVTFTKIAILDDGYAPRGRNYKQPLVQNTHGFDIACYLILCRMADDDQYKITVLNTMTETMTNYMKTYTEKGTHKDTYLARNNILQTLYKKETIGGFEVVDCMSTPLQNIQKFYTNKLPSAIISPSCDCKKTRKLKNSETVSIFKWHENVPLNSLNLLNEFHCKKRKVNSSEISFGNLIFIDTNNQHKIFNQIPQAILLGDRVCILYSIIETVSSGHHIAHIKRCNQAWYKFDTKTKKVSAAKIDCKDISVHILAYTCVSIAEPCSKKSTKTKPKSFEVIQNFHSCIFNGVTVNVRNVCAPDAFFHIFAKLYSAKPDIFETKCLQTTFH